MSFRVRVVVSLLAIGLLLHACGGGSLPPTPSPIPIPTATATLIPSHGVIFAAGDISCDSATPQLACRSRATSDLILAEKARNPSVPIVVLPLGDLQYNSGTLVEFTRNYNETWGRLNEAAHPVPGNHEYETRGAIGYFDYFQTKSVAVGARNEGWYSYDKGDWHFIALNSNCGPIGGCTRASAQGRWLQGDLLQNRSKKCTVAYMHHPWQSSGTNGGTPDVEPLIQLLHENNVEIVLAGHDHDYERFLQVTPQLVADSDKGLRLFVVGTGGRDLQGYTRTHSFSAYRNNSHFGVLKILMKDGSYEWGFVNTDGVVFDPGSGVCF
jgi:hypothetical protein